MKVKLNSILLVDDNPATNLIHERVISKVFPIDNLHVCTSGEQALELITGTEGNEHTQPQLIFLDINMPGMSGWDFIEEYEQLPDSQKGGIIIVMLTTSINPDDKLKADSLKSISGFLNKPLTVDVIKSVIEEHFVV